MAHDEAPATPLLQDLLIEVDGRGQVKPSRVATARLGGAPGVWRLCPDIGRVMVLERVVDNRPDTRSARAVTLAGTFDDATVLAGFLEVMHVGKWDGAFHVRAGELHKVLYLRRGVLLAARSSDRQDRLGQVMVRHGLLTEQQRRECAEACGESSRFGSVLVARGLMTNAGVYEGLRLQTEQIVASLLALGGGSFHLVQPLNMTEVPAMLRLDVQQLLMDGMRLLDESRDRASRPDRDDELRRRRPVAAGALPPDGARRIVEAYNGALRTLFGSIDEAARAALLDDLREYLQDNAEQDPLLRDVDVDGDGSLGVQLLANVALIRDADPAAHLQLSLNELLFFMMFVAGDLLAPGVEQRLQQEVARALHALPTSRP